MRASLDLKGLEDYLEKLTAMGQDIDAIADEALAAGAEVIYDAMFAAAPERTGKLKAHILIKPQAADGNYHAIKIGVYEVDRENQMYFFYEEMGSAHNPAHPYVRPAFGKHRRDALDAMKAVFKRYGAV